MKKEIQQKYTLEVCANSIQSAINAALGGADRIELCGNISEGGITPSSGIINEVRSKIDLDIFILIRPREGNFIYDTCEFEAMKKDIIECAKAGCQGVVTGVLNRYGEIDLDKNIELVEIAKSYNLKITFHRAIDRTKNILKSVEDIVNTGFDRILTSGGYPKAHEGMKNIREMNSLFGDQIEIIAGSGVNSENVLEILEYTKINEVHGTFSSILKTEKENNYQNPNMNESFHMSQTDLNKVKEIRNLLDKLSIVR